MTANGQEQPKKTIDERLDALAESLELLAGMQKASEERIDKLTAVVEKHEQQWQRAGRAMRAALEAWFEEDGNQ